jgi:hypothetical protein
VTDDSIDSDKTVDPDEGASESKADLSFKYISVPRAGLKGDDPFTDLYYHLLVEGIQYEDETRRAPLPRRLQSWSDIEQSLIDRLRLANLGDRLRQAAASRLDNNLQVDRLSTVNSETSVPGQVADLVAASVNRVLNAPGSSHNHKDRIARYVCNRLGIEPRAGFEGQIGDMTVHIAL